jgi:hypothetical protein
MQIRFYYESLWLKIGIVNNFYWKSPILNFNKICETVYGSIYGPVQIMLYELI